MDKLLEACSGDTVRANDPRRGPSSDRYARKCSEIFFADLPLAFRRPQPGLDFASLNYGRQPRIRTTSALPRRIDLSSGKAAFGAVKLADLHAGTSRPNRRNTARVSCFRHLVRA